MGTYDSFGTMLDQFIDQEAGRQEKPKKEFTVSILGPCVGASYRTIRSWIENTTRISIEQVRQLAVCLNLDFMQTKFLLDSYQRSRMKAPEKDNAVTEILVANSLITRSLVLLDVNPAQAERDFSMVLDIARRHENWQLVFNTCLKLGELYTSHIQNLNLAVEYLLEGKKYELFVSPVEGSILDGLLCLCYCGLGQEDKANEIFVSVLDSVKQLKGKINDPKSDTFAIEFSTTILLILMDTVLTMYYSVGDYLKVLEAVKEALLLNASGLLKRPGQCDRVVIIVEWIAKNEDAKLSDETREKLLEKAGEIRNLLERTNGFLSKRGGDPEIEIRSLKPDVIRICNEMIDAYQTDKHITSSEQT